MPFWRFTVLTLIGSLPWVLALALAGHALGSDWTSVRKGFQYVDYADPRAARSIGIVYAIVRRRRDAPPAPIPRGGGRGGLRSEPDHRRGLTARDGVASTALPPPRSGTRPGTRPDRAAARLLLGPHGPHPLARRVALRRARPGAAQVLRGGAPRRNRRGAPARSLHRQARRAAPAGSEWAHTAPTGARRRSTRARLGRSRSRSHRRRSPATRSSSRLQRRLSGPAHNRRRPAHRGGGDGARRRARHGRRRAPCRRRARSTACCSALAQALRAGPRGLAQRRRPHRGARAAASAARTRTCSRGALGLPVILGAGALKIGRLLQRGGAAGDATSRPRADSRARRGAAFLSTLAAIRLLAAG